MINQENVRSAHYLSKTWIVSYLYHWLNVFSFCKCATHCNTCPRLSPLLFKKKLFLFVLLLFPVSGEQAFLFIEICLLVQFGFKTPLLVNYIYVIVTSCCNCNYPFLDGCYEEFSKTSYCLLCLLWPVLGPSRLMVWQTLVLFVSLF